MRIPSNYEVTRAVLSDGEAINRVFESGSFEGGIAVQYLRQPNTLASYEREADEVVMLIGRDLDNPQHLIGTGACTIREGWLEGGKARIAYLAGLKVIPEYQKKVPIMPQVYEKMHEMTRDMADVYITTILSENMAVHKMLEKPRKSMPRYEYLGDYHTYFCKAGKGRRDGGVKAGKDGWVRRCERDEVVQFYKNHVKKLDLSLYSPVQNDFAQADFFGYYVGGELAGAGYVLNQQDYKQYVVRAYGGAYKFLSKLPTGILGYPSFPQVDHVANCANAQYWIKDGLADRNLAAGRLWKGMLKLSCDYDFLMLGLFDQDWRNGLMKHSRKITYDSRLYQVIWPQDTGGCRLKRAQLELDVALL